MQSGRPDPSPDGKIDVAALLRYGQQALQSRNLDNAGLDTQVLLAHCLERDRTFLFTHPEYQPTPEQVGAFYQHLGRRAAGEPIAYLLGQREFWGLMLDVSPAVLIPRPETEELVEHALAIIAQCVQPRILDLGTGSGAIALALAKERPDARITASDTSPAALAVAQANGQRLGLQRVQFVQSDWYQAIEQTSMDLIISNPPYVADGDPHIERGDCRFEPRLALTPGRDELSAYQAILDGVDIHLKEDGHLLVEHGYDQQNALCAMFDRYFSQVNPLHDLAGQARMIHATGKRR